MGLILSYTKRKKGKIFALGNSLDMLLMVVITCNSIADKIAKENGINIDEAMKLVIESISEGKETLN